MQKIVKINANATPNKVAVIKLVRAASGLGLKEAKDLVEETMGSTSTSYSELSGSWNSEADFEDWHRQMIENDVLIVGHVFAQTLPIETHERLVGNCQNLIIDCVMDRAWNLARDLIDVLERHDGRNGDQNG